MDSSFLRSQLLDLDSALAEEGEDVVVFSARRPRSTDERVHCCTLAVPASVRCCYLGVDVVSVEYLFLQFASVLKFQALIQLGSVLCMRESYTTPKKLRALALKLKGHRGRRQALRAIAYIVENTDSLMEIHLGKVFSLPPKLGGVGFKGMKQNVTIRLSKKAAEFACKKEVRADFFFPDANLIVEYNGAYHGSAYQQTKDKQRCEALRMMGYTVIEIEKDDLYNLTNFYINLKRIARNLGHRLTIRTPQFEPNFRILRAMLPRQEWEEDQLEKWRVEAKRNSEIEKFLRLMRVPGWD